MRHGRAADLARRVERMPRVEPDGSYALRDTAQRLERESGSRRGG